ncbi:MAG: hypothetical protein MZV70_60480 [Desulfobacterales bacterium]|nr:hypothetical protein [Desulfobacterales bacterium]
MLTKQAIDRYIVPPAAAPRTRARGRRRPTPEHRPLRPGRRRGRRQRYAGAAEIDGTAARVALRGAGRPGAGGPRPAAPRRPGGPGAGWPRSSCCWWSSTSCSISPRR